MIEVLCSDQEYTVRTEVVVLITCIYDQDIHNKDYIMNLFDMMLRILKSERHRRVKIALIDFWQKVINVVLKLQGMIDGEFPEATFSKALKRIITFDKPKIKSCLSAALMELGKNGCLAAFMFILRQKNDHEVCEAAEKNLIQLIDLLHKYKLNDCDMKENDFDSHSNCGSPYNFNGVLSPSMSLLEPTDLDSLEIEKFWDTDFVLPNQHSNDGLKKSDDNSSDEFLKFVNLEMDQHRNRHKAKANPQDDLDSLIDYILKVV